MKVAYANSFVRDLKKLKNRKTGARVLALVEAAKVAMSPAALGDLVKLTDYEDCYRIRVGDHRVGVYINGDRIEFVRALPRKEFYRLFPPR